MWISKDRKWYEVKGSKAEENRIKYRTRKIMDEKDKELIAIETERLKRGYCKVCHLALTVTGICSYNSSHSQA